MNELHVQPRGFFARIGICLLNLPLPGLGLIRLARYRAGTLFIGITWGAVLLIVGAYALVAEMTPTLWLGLVALILALLSVAYLGSIGLSWVASRQLRERSGWGWPWYALLGIATISTGLSEPVGNFGTSFYKGYYSPAESMIPALEVYDRFLVDRNGIDPIRRGDIVVAESGGEEWVKRVAGLPGDTIVMVGGTVVLNGKPVVQNAIQATARNTAFGETYYSAREQFPGEAKPHIVLDSSDTPVDDFTARKLGPDQYFLLGDNRDHSADSRLPAGGLGRGLGPISRGQITGRAVFRYWRSGQGFDTETF